MIRFRKSMLAAVVLAAAAVLAGPASQARASNIVVDVFINGHQVDHFTGATAASSGLKTYSYGGTTFTNVIITATDNQPGDPSAGNLAQTNISAGGSTGTGTLDVKVQETQGFTLPGSAGNNMIVDSKVSNSTTNAQGTLTFQSWVNPAGSPFTGVTPGLQTYDVTKPGNAAPNEVATTFVRGASYYLSNELTLTAGDSNLNVSGTTTVTTPAPAGLVLALAGLPFLGIGGWLRRRRRQA